MVGVSGRKQVSEGAEEEVATIRKCTKSASAEEKEPRK